MNLNLFHHKRALFLLYIFFFFVALFFRCLHISYYSIQSRDSYIYVDEIAELQEKKSLDERRHPALAVYLMGIPSMYFGIDIIKGGVITNMILGELIVLLLIKTCYNILKTPISMLYVGIIASSNNNLIYYSTQLLRENSYLFFVCAALELLTRKKKENLFNTSLLGVITICAFLCRFEGLEIILLYTVFKVIGFLLDKYKTKRKFRTLVINQAFYMFTIVIALLFVMYFYNGRIQLHGLGVFLDRFHDLM